MEELTETFKTAWENFQREVSLTDKQKVMFGKTTLQEVKQEIRNTQRDQERRKGMINFTRCQLFLQGFTQFDEACKSLNMGLAELSPSIWGPTLYVWQLAKEDGNVLDAILESYERFGRSVPLLAPYRDNLGKTPVMRQCLAYMYHDLLSFYQDVLKLFKERNWKRTFHESWRDYYNHRFETVIKSFEGHGVLVKTLLENDRNQGVVDTSIRLNQHITQYNGDREDIREHIRAYEDDQEAVSRDREALRDHINMYQEDRVVLHGHIRTYGEDREVFHGHFQALDEHIRTYEEDRAVLLQNSRAAEEERKNSQYLAVKSWISGPEQAKYHEKFCQTREEFRGTCRWILGEDKVRSWLSNDAPGPSMLWLNAKMGAGKTILASLIIDECRKNPDFKTSYFYCREDDSNQNTFMAILKGLLCQLVGHKPSLLPYCYEKCLRGEEILNDEATAKSLIQLFCDSSMSQFIILDGLDECDALQRKSVLDFLATVVRKCDDLTPGRIRVLLLSRDLPDVRKRMQTAGMGILDLNPKHTQSDISRFVEKKIPALKEKFQELRERETELVKTLTWRRSNGMFLFAFLVMENLLEQPDIGSLNAELRNFPEDLGAAYCKIIERLSRDLGRNQWVVAKKIFGWLACAKRPLKWHEIQAALSIQEDKDGRFALDFRSCSLRDDIRDICGGLVQVVQGSRIEFIHQTARQYMLKSDHLDERKIECDLLTLCLNYLSKRFFRPHMQDEDRKTLAMEGYYAFQDYAISKWEHHLESVIHKCPPLLGDGARGSAAREKLAGTLKGFNDAYRAQIVAGPEPETGGRRGNSSRNSNSSSSQEQAQRLQELNATLAKNAVEDCKPFENFVDLHGELLLLWTHVHTHQRGDCLARNKVSIKDLEEALTESRKILEDAEDRINNRSGNNNNSRMTDAERDQASARLQRFYGAGGMYKCDRITCYFFHEGFATRGAKERHAQRHDRPFHCPVEGCSISPFGFANNKDRERHVQNSHPDQAGVPAPFPQLGRRVIADPRFQCERCGKCFTRLANKKAHIDSHLGVRDFRCSTCGKAFGRQNDRRRHETTVHVHGRRAGRA